MGSKKSAAPPKPSGPTPEQIAAEQKAAADQAAAKVAADEAAKVKAEREKAIQGGESAEDIAAREQSTLANPKKQKLKGRRSLVSQASLGSGVGSSRETLG